MQNNTLPLYAALSKACGAGPPLYNPGRHLSCNNTTGHRSTAPRFANAVRIAYDIERLDKAPPAYIGTSMVSYMENPADN